MCESLKGKLVGVHPTCLLTKTQGNFEEAHHWNIQAKLYNENSHQYMKVTKQETLYHEEHGAILKHKCGKRQQHCPFSLFLSFFCLGSLASLFSFFWWASLAFFLFPHMGQCFNNDDHHTLIYSQLNAQNDEDSIGNASSGVPERAMIQLGV